MIHALFPTQTCARCAREVLLYHDLDEAGALVLRCLHCDALSAAPSAPASAPSAPDAVRMINARAARKLGYLFEGDDPEPPPAGCGKPNCGNGTCKNSGKRHPFA